MSVAKIRPPTIIKNSNRERKIAQSKRINEILQSFKHSKYPPPTLAQLRQQQQQKNAFVGKRHKHMSGFILFRNYHLKLIQTIYNVSPEMKKFSTYVKEWWDASDYKDQYSQLCDQLKTIQNDYQFVIVQSDQLAASNNPSQFVNDSSTDDDNVLFSIFLNI
jgi:hypothetical protein